MPKSSAKPSAARASAPLLAVPLDDQVCFTLYATSMAVTRLYKPMLDRMGITYPQYLILAVLGEAAEQTVGAIAAHLFLESSTVTPPLKRLEQAGLVTRQRSAEDEREVKVRLTAAGRKLLEKCNCLGDELLARSGMTMTELLTLNRRIQTLRDALMAEQPGT
jgi:DNA-binding MarR family transcriptional regulator